MQHNYCLHLDKDAIHREGVAILELSNIPYHKVCMSDLNSFTSSEDREPERWRERGSMHTSTDDYNDQLYISIASNAVLCTMKQVASGQGEYAQEPTQNCTQQKTAEVMWKVRLG